MNFNQESSTLDRKSSRKLYNLLFDRSSHVGNNIRGFVVFDRNHKKVGTIGDIYCDQESLKPRYVEIIPTGQRLGRPVMYPYDYLKIHGEEGRVFLSSTAADLFEHEEYGFDHFMETEGPELMTFNEALGVDSREYFSKLDFHRCA